ncbi:MAG: methyltransferase domain-containing protein [Phycisphaerae bacterium]
MPRPPVCDIAVDVTALDRPIDPAAWFPAPAPLELEIGCGRGGFLVRVASEHPERHFVGIEWANKFHRYAADRMARRGLTNVRVVRTDARQFVIHRLVPACLAALHVYHPDPWPKKRHHKRRLFCPEFVAAAIRALRPAARLAIQTDHAEYFSVIESLLAGRAELQPVPFDDAHFGTLGERIETNYETKYLREGRAMHRLAFRKVAPA